MRLRLPSLAVACLAPLVTGDLTTIVYVTTVVDSSKTTSTGVPASSSSVYATEVAITSTFTCVNFGHGDKIKCGGPTTWKETSTTTSWSIGPTPQSVYDVAVTATKTITTVSSFDKPADRDTNKPPPPPSSSASGPILAPPGPSQSAAPPPTSSDVVTTLKSVLVGESAEVSVRTEDAPSQTAELNQAGVFTAYSTVRVPAKASWADSAPAPDWALAILVWCMFKIAATL